MNFEAERCDGTRAVDSTVAGGLTVDVMRTLQAGDKGVGQEDGHAVRLGQALKPRGQVHMRGEVAGIDLVAGPDGTLDAPPHVEPES